MSIRNAVQIRRRCNMVRSLPAEWRRREQDCLNAIARSFALSGKSQMKSCFFSTEEREGESEPDMNLHFEEGKKHLQSSSSPKWAAGKQRLGKHANANNRGLAFPRTLNGRRRLLCQFDILLLKFSATAASRQIGRIA